MRLNTKALINCSLTLFLLYPLMALPDTAGKPVTAHAVAMHGDIKYPPNFTHFEYVNPDAPKGGKIKLGAIGTFDSLNPFIPKGQRGDGIGMIYDTLTRASSDEPFTEYGLLAQSIELPEDRSWVTFHLNPKARFHDGKAITAEDVVFTFELLRSKGHPIYKATYADVLKAEALSTLSVKFTFKNAQNPELALVVGQLAVLPKHFWKDRDFEKASLEVPLGSGPYRIKKVDPGHSLSFERVDNYWAKDLAVNKGMYNFDIVQFDYYRDTDVAVEAIKAGEYDYRYENSSKSWATSYNNVNPLFKKWEPHDASPTGMQGFIFNVRNPLFADPRVRKALNYAFDFEWTNKNIFYDAYTRTDSYFSNSELASSELPTGRELEILQPYRKRLPASVFTEAFKPPVTDGTGRPRQNLRIAKELLTQSGWVIKDHKLVNEKTGQPFSFEVLLYSPAFERIVNPFIKNLSRLGIHAEIRMVDTSQYLNRTRNFEFEMLVWVFGQGLSPGNEQRAYWHSTSADIDASRNLIGIKNPVIDDLIELIIKAPNREELVYRTRALDRVLLHNYFVIPHYHNRTHRIAYWDKFNRPKLSPKYDQTYQTGLFTWWIDTDKQANLDKQRNSSN